MYVYCNSSTRTSKSDIKIFDSLDSFRIFLNQRFIENIAAQRNNFSTNWYYTNHPEKLQQYINDHCDGIDIRNPIPFATYLSLKCSDLWLYPLYRMHLNNEPVPGSEVYANGTLYWSSKVVKREFINYINQNPHLNVMI